MKEIIKYFVRTQRFLTSIQQHASLDWTRSFVLIELLKLILLPPNPSTNDLFASVNAVLTTRSWKRGQRVFRVMFGERPHRSDEAHSFCHWTFLIIIYSLLWAMLRTLARGVPKHGMMFSSFVDWSQLHQPVNQSVGQVSYNYKLKWKPLTNHLSCPRRGVKDIDSASPGTQGPASEICALTPSNMTQYQSGAHEEVLSSTIPKYITQKGKGRSRDIEIVIRGYTKDWNKKNSTECIPRIEIDRRNPRYI
jgi:hypothetical protein